MTTTIKKIKIAIIPPANSGIYKNVNYIWITSMFSYEDKTIMTVNPRKIMAKVPCNNITG